MSSFRLELRGLIFGIPGVHSTTLLWADTFYTSHQYKVLLQRAKKRGGLVIKKDSLILPYVISYIRIPFTVIIHLKKSL